MNRIDETEKAISEQLEPVAIAHADAIREESPTHGFSKASIAEVSIAISLKRIADAMEVPRFIIPDGLDLSDLSRGAFRVMPDDGK